MMRWWARDGREKREEMGGGREGGTKERRVKQGGEREGGTRCRRVGMR